MSDTWSESAIDGLLIACPSVVLVDILIICAGAFSRGVEPAR
uniref:Uncharacterized protein n=1 Tax=Rhizophora mucronata TaxID=61149 RepID=A0A2P2P5R3_RHIMU